ncbi:hypothetical protein H5399_12510 [Tessaracoccus sp. MC1627]|uniref:hypothetical protein n=1 Tax=Tessaracoccus sp. MC1627 TaxID=2760312 RepID=UPI001603C7FF|nr:hypothetical protein [Tessaracoccus sp. MC1627]MBB1513251.1 hypothetical protein [Tessaracoccus sp. MC1627]MBB1513416.1 hypothetical protein [Tessaracoccus sp. MC1627]
MRRRPRFAVQEPADGSVLRWPGATAKFALLGEVLWVGILMAVACLPLVTWPAAFAAGASHLRRFLRGESSTVAQFVDDVRRAMPGGVGVGAGSLLLGGLVALDLRIAADGALPGAAGIAVVLTAAAGVAAVLILTAAASWRPGLLWRGLLAEAPRRLSLSPFVAVMTAVALGLAVVITWQYLLLLVPALGVLTFAVVAIHERDLVDSAG